MPVFARVVVGLDGSKSASHALRWAVDRVPSTDGIHIVHAKNPHGFQQPIVPTDLELATMRCSDQPAPQALIDVAAEVDADAIVVGPHGSGLGYGLGSVTKELLRDSSLPVIVVEDPEPPRSVGLAPPVVACVGYGDPADSAASWAADFAAERSLPLVLLHSVAYRPVFPLDSASDVLASYLGTGVSMTWARDELDAMAKRLQADHPDLRISTHVESSSIIKAVRHAGETAELVVLGKRGQEEFMSKIGTPRLRRLVARAQFPTAVVPTAPAP